MPHTIGKLITIEMTEEVRKMSNQDSTSPESEAMMSIVRQRYGDRLNEEQLQEVQKRIDGIAKAAEALRAVKLENGDEPFSIFAPYRVDDLS